MDLGCCHCAVVSVSALVFFVSISSSFPCNVSVSRYTSEMLTANVAELNARLKTISSRINQAADAQLQRQFQGFLEVPALYC